MKIHTEKQYRQIKQVLKEYYDQPVVYDYYQELELAALEWERIHCRVPKRVQPRWTKHNMPRKERYGD